MKAKEILRALVSSGNLNADIHLGNKITPIVTSIVYGSIKPRKEYLYMFHKIQFVNEDCAAITKAGEKIYLYSL